MSHSLELSISLSGQWSLWPQLPPRELLTFLAFSVACQSAVMSCFPLDQVRHMSSCTSNWCVNLSP